MQPRLNSGGTPDVVSVVANENIVATTETLWIV
jgi:hypothetical protein